MRFTRWLLTQQDRLDEIGSLAKDYSIKYKGSSDNFINEDTIANVFSQMHAIAYNDAKKEWRRYIEKNNFKLIPFEVDTLHEHCGDTVLRYKVFGGWMVRDFALDNGDGLAMTTVFVPDKDHQWVVDYDVK